MTFSFVIRHKIKECLHAVFRAFLSLYAFLLVILLIQAAESLRVFEKRNISVFRTEGASTEHPR